MRQPHNPPIHPLLLLNPVILHLKVIILAEKRPHLLRVRPRPLIIPIGKHPRHSPRKTSRQSDQPLMMPLKQLHINPRLRIKPLSKPPSHHINQIPVPDIILTKQHKMITRGILPMRLIKPSPPGKINLAPDNRLYPLLLTGIIKRHRAIHNPMVSYSAGRMPALLRTHRYLRDPTRAVKQTILTMKMQMDKIRHTYLRGSGMC